MHIITRSGVLFLWMLMLTLVKSKDDNCTLQQFLNGPLFDSNFDTTNLETQYSSGKHVRVSCNIGYSGFFKLMCVEGTWESKGDPCKPKLCGHPGDALFGDFHLEKGDDFVFGSQVVYTCQRGYQMVSRRNYRRCMTQGWDGLVPICEAQQCPVIHVASNVQVIGDPEDATYGNVLRFSCKSNANILIGLAELYCDENGEWSGQPPVCNEIKCLVPEIENGYVPGDIKEYKEHEVLHFRCNPSYKTVEARQSKCIKQGSRADWIPTPLCELVTCKLTLPPLEGTSYEPVFKNVFSPGETVRVTCGRRYWIGHQQDTSAVTTCKGDGQWSASPVCQVVTCLNQRPRHVSYWDIRWGNQVTMDETTRYQCRSGYRKTGGATEATCSRDGWKPDPLCEAITCKTQSYQDAEIDGFDRQEYRFNERVNYICKAGYEGRFTLTCGGAGWIGTHRCTMITCRTQSYQDAEIDGFVLQEYRFNDKVNYICKAGYEGRFTLTCGGAGWIGTHRCTRKLCEKPNVENAQIIRNRKEIYAYTDIVGYACKNNHERVFTITCGEGGWTGIQNCSACLDPKIPHGFAIGPHSDILYYTCKQGYKLPTKGWWAKAKCNDGLWSGLEQCIVNTTCGDLPVIPNGRVTPSRSDEGGRIICDEGYKAQATRLTCIEGNWYSNGVLPEAICKSTAYPCNHPPKVENAVVEGLYQKEYLSGSTVTYRCRDKYTTMEGEDKIKCQNGTWEKKEINCTAYCDKLEDVKMNFTADQERYMDGDYIKYQCVTSDVKGIATCVKSMWNKSEECEGKEENPNSDSDIVRGPMKPQ